MPLSTSTILNNRYRIVRLLGEGGFGAVYRAWDLNLERPCAIKENLVITSESQRQFKREAKMLADLAHPNLPRVIDHFIIPGQGQYLVMDFVEGENLEALLEDRASTPFGEAQVLDWIEQVCSALDYLHRQVPPVIHRDIKPANIKITPEGKAVLVDFGIAKLFDPHSETTVGAQAVTPGYSPPEQYGGGFTTVQSDVYALGATAYTLLTGQVLPSSVHVMTRSVPQPIPVRQLNPAVSERTSQAVMSAIQTDCELRPASINAFLSALKSTTAEVQPTAPVSLVGPAVSPVAVPQSASVPASPRPTWIPWLGGALAIFAVVAVAYLLSQTIISPPAAAIDREGTATALVGLPARTPTFTSAPTTAAPEGMVLIPAGSFMMGSDAGPDDELPAHEVFLDAYYIDPYEVTNAEYAEFLNEIGNQEQGGVKLLNAGDADSRILLVDDVWQAEMGYADHPVVEVSWYGARAYCEWRSSRLPTEAEWEAAARGGLEGGQYPWGDEAPTCQAGVENGAQFAVCEGPPVPVGTFSPNGYGLYDMAGNVWEWVSSLYQPYPYDAMDGREHLDSSGSRTLRGGSWVNERSALRVTNRSTNIPNDTNFSIGFRCARSP